MTTLNKKIIENWMGASEYNMVEIVFDGMGGVDMDAFNEINTINDAPFCDADVKVALELLNDNEATYEDAVRALLNLQKSAGAFLRNHAIEVGQLLGAV
jgi:hypothetical protein